MFLIPGQKEELSACSGPSEHPAAIELTNSAFGLFDDRDETILLIFKGKHCHSGDVLLLIAEL